MVLFDSAFGLVFLALWVFCVIDVITTPEAAVRNLPKLVWVVIVVLLSTIGAVLWLVAGRPWSARSGEQAEKVNAFAFGARPNSARATRARVTNPDDDDEFLATLTARTQEQRRRAQEGEDKPDAS